MGWLRFVIFVVFVLAGCSPALISGGSDYRGQVVDADTNEPIEGAVVVIVWYKKPAVSMNGPQYFHRAEEALTDSEGRFTLNASSGIDVNPFTYVLRDPRIVIFKPGYGPFPRAHVSSKSIEEIKRAFLQGGAVIRLPKLKNKEDLRKYSDPGDLMISSLVPYDKIPELTRLINRQRAVLGFPPIGGNR